MRDKNKSYDLLSEEFVEKWNYLKKLLDQKRTNCLLD